MIIDAGNRFHFHLEIADSLPRLRGHSPKWLLPWRAQLMRYDISFEVRIAAQGAMQFVDPPDAFTLPSGPSDKRLYIPCANEGCSASWPNKIAAHASDTISEKVCLSMGRLIKELVFHEDGLSLWIYIRCARFLLACSPYC